MKVGIISAFVDYHRKGRKHRGILQPQIGPLIAALLPPEVDVEVVNDTWEDPDWTKDYDLLFLSGLHSDFDRTRQIAHYWRRRGTKTVYGGTLASNYPSLCRPFFDSIVIGDPEDTVPQIYDDFCRGELQPTYVSSGYRADRIPTPRFDLLARKQIVPIAFEATRGCPFSCEFCALTGIGTRHHTRAPEMVVQDIRMARQMLRGMVARHKLQLVIFDDNNIGGNLAYLRQLCEALAPEKIRWGSAITFNCVADPEIVKTLARSGCYFLFMGLESFNQEAIADMHKGQNAIEKTRLVMDQCRANGIVVVSGLMLNPNTDDCRYIETIPSRLTECGLHVPSFISFECPIPGTPHFHRLAAEQEPALLPNALLRDFNGYTLVTRPKRESVETFVGMYKWLHEEVFSFRSRMKKLADDLPRFLAGGHWFSALTDVLDQAVSRYRPHPDRTYLAGTDVPPPEVTSVPFTDADFDSEDERNAILEPWRVTDSTGHVLPAWRNSITVFDKGGALSAAARRRLIVPEALTQREPRLSA